MAPVLTTLSLFAFLGLGLAGLRMLRSPVAWDRFEPERLEDRVDAKPEKVSLVARASEALRPTALSFTSEASLRRYRRRLDSAGRPEGITVEDFLARRAVYVVALGGAGLLLTLAGRPFMGTVVAAVGFLLQDLWLRRAATQRQAALERQLPDFLDILSITVEAGLGFQSAFRRVAAAFQGPLGEEVETALRQMELGVPRREAFEGLRQRNDSVVLDSFVVALRQAEELGAPLSDTLRSMADELREQWNQQARRRAAQSVPRVSIIVAFTLVPASLIMVVAAMLASSGTGTGAFS